DNSRWTILHIVAHQLLQGKDDEARQELLRVENSSPELLTGELARLASQAAFDQNQLADAERLSRKVDPNSGNYRDALWLAELKIARGDLGPEVEKLIKTAVDRFPEERAVWLVYVDYLVRAERKDEASAIAKQAAQSLPAEPPQLRPATLAIC